jgi:hypothetical protein
MYAAKLRKKDIEGPVMRKSPENRDFLAWRMGLQPSCCNQGRKYDSMD